MRKLTIPVALILGGVCTPAFAETVLEGAKPYTHAYCDGLRSDRDEPFVAPPGALLDVYSPGSYMMDHREGWDASGCGGKGGQTQKPRLQDIPQK